MWVPWRGVLAALAVTKKNLEGTGVGFDLIDFQQRHGSARALAYAGGRLLDRAECPGGAGIHLVLQLFCLPSQNPRFESPSKDSRSSNKQLK